MKPDPDDDLGRRLGVLLAPPGPLQARSDAGRRLRSRARSVSRLRQGAALAMAGVVAIVAVTLASHQSRHQQAATGRWSGSGWLTTPVEIGTGTPVDAQPCDGADRARVGPGCLLVTDSPLVVRQVVSIRVVPGAAGAGAVELDLVSENQADVNSIVNTGRGDHLVAFVDAIPYPATIQPNRHVLEIALLSVADAEQLVGVLGIRPDYEPAIGLGELDTPLTVRPVLRSTDPTCAGTAVQYHGKCLLLGAAVLTVRSVQNLSILGPDRQSPDVRIQVELGAEAGAILGAYSAGHVGQQIVFEVRGHLVDSPYRIDHRIDRTVDIHLSDQCEAERVFRELRPWRNNNTHQGTVVRNGDRC
jgi:hypothetical protein